MINCINFKDCFSKLHLPSNQHRYTHKGVYTNVLDACDKEYQGTSITD